VATVPLRDFAAFLPPLLKCNAMEVEEMGRPFQPHLTCFWHLGLQARASAFRSLKLAAAQFISQADKLSRETAGDQGRIPESDGKAWRALSISSF